ncbi:MAG: radical SAM protein [Proteobacteria bacterium]|nr:radical SAM protein [Pseudomonadota bacterium]
MSQPSYIRLFHEGVLEERAEAARKMLESCRVCPRECGVDRTAGETGHCRTGARAWVSSFNAHFGEEDPLVGRHGSGTIFFTHCNLLCLFCQNYDISHMGEGQEVRPEVLAALMMELARAGCHNINFVTPTHVVPQILEALPLAVQAGLRLPLVYNSGGYDSVETLKLLDGVFDIYMPDFKFWDEEAGRRYCQVPDYPERARAAVLEMHRQVGDLTMDAEGVAVRGLLVRHLVMPDGRAGTRDVARFLARDVSPETYVNVMGQYRPCGRAREFPELARPLTSAELREAEAVAREEGLRRLDERRRVLLARL